VRSLLPALAVLPFVVLATLNSAGYRYGASDQAFYVPAILDQLQPALYPRDSDLIYSQARLTLVDEAVAGVARATGLTLPALLGVLSVAALALMVQGAVGIGAVLYRTWWATAALLAALTLRHAIMETGTNTLEGYFHPRQLAFGLGSLALASFLRRGPRLIAVPLVLAALIHPTTAAWFVVWLGVATFVSEPRLRTPIVGAAAIGAAAAVWALVSGPLRGRFARMDELWLATLDSKDYLFPLEWPPLVWLVNVGYVVPIVWLFLRRRAAGLLAPREQALVVGVLSLLLVFAVALVLQAQRLAIAMQLQPARIFWMLDFLATIYAVWAVSEMGGVRRRRAAAAATAIIALSCARGAYVCFVHFPERRLIQIDIPDDDWGRVMGWARSSALHSHWLADPFHAALYGTSVRVAGRRDVFVEEIKDTAIGLYERPVAIRTRERLEALGNFRTLSPQRARDLAKQYGLDYLVTEQPIDLPVAFSSGPIRVYTLR
jgi:hypothetical protein